MLYLADDDHLTERSPGVFSPRVTPDPEAQKKLEERLTEATAQLARLRQRTPRRFTGWPAPGY